MKEGEDWVREVRKNVGEGAKEWRKRVERGRIWEEEEARLG